MYICNTIFMTYDIINSNLQTILMTNWLIYKQIKIYEICAINKWKIPNTY